LDKFKGTVRIDSRGKLKATHKISFADAWVAATAIMLSAILVHKDPEFEELEDELEMLKLPYKKS